MDEIKLWRGKVTDLALRIRALLVKDAAVYLQRAIREGVAASPARVAACSKEELRALKAQTTAAEGSAIEALEAALTEAVFFEASRGGDSLKSLPSLAAALKALETATRASLKAADLAETEAATYRLPVRFIDGDDLVTLTRGLWKARGQLTRAEAIMEVKVTEAAQSEALARWDDL